MILKEIGPPCEPWHLAVVKAWEESWLEENGKPWTDETHGLPDSPPSLWAGEVEGKDGPWLILASNYSDVSFYLSEKAVWMEGEIFPAGDAFELVDKVRRFAEVRDAVLNGVTE